MLPVVYGELKKLANAYMARLRPGQTMQPTELVHEAYARLDAGKDVQWNSRGHFFGAAAQAMREILVDYARRKAALKRGGDHERVEMVTFADERSHLGMSADEILALNRALDKLEERLPEHAQVVLLRFFAGLTMEQIAEGLDVSTKTVQRKWQVARAWLKKELSQG